MQANSPHSGRSETFVLYGSPHSQFTYKVALMLRLCRTPFSFRYVSFQKGMHKTDQFRSLSRWGEVPVLQHRGQSLVQSGAILLYLAESLSAFGGPPSAYQEIREWLFWDADRFARPVYGCYGTKLRQLNLLAYESHPTIEKDDRRRVVSALDALNAGLAGREFLVGRELSIADLACFGETAFARMCDFDLLEWRHVQRWIETISRLDGFSWPLDLLPMADLDQ